MLSFRRPEIDPGCRCYFDDKEAAPRINFGATIDPDKFAAHGLSFSVIVRNRGNTVIPPFAIAVYHGVAIFEGVPACPIDRSASSSPSGRE
jgi:hypothetical protein